MARKYNGRPNSGFIDNVKHPARFTGFDVQDERVRHKSIGDLSQAYRRRYPGHQVEPMATTYPAAHSHYTRVPSLRLLDLRAEELIPMLAEQSERYRGNFESWLTSLRGKLLTAGSAVAALGAFVVSRLRPTNINWVPKTYTSYEGLNVNRSKAAKMFARWGAPVLAALAGIIIATILLSPFSSRQTKPGAGTSRTPVVVTPTRNSGKSSSRSKTKPTPKPVATSAVSQTTGSGGSASAPSSSASSAYSPASSYYIAPSAGGRGADYTSSTTPSSGGSSSGGSSSGSGSGGLRISQTVTVPPAKVSAGGKTLVSTPGTSATVDPTVP